ncbi:MAG: SusC/RagA family TonB-linked outer membrane protein [Porphyromonas sp.]|nr:SusC/RagA family TonB-linked outer membrane protein [Porphyromonas sp.]
MKRMTYLGALSLVTLVSTAQALHADRLIKGIVRDADDGSPIVGATVYVHPTELKRSGASAKSLGTTTDINGAYNLTIPEGVRVIRVSYVGMREQEIAIKAGVSSYEVQLQSDNKLNEVVVTGYQTTERRRLTAAITKVELSDAVLGGVKSVDQALAGQIAGVSVVNATGTPGAPARIRIRGTASLNGTQDPLWVLDGIPLEGTDIPKMDSSNDNDITNIGQSSIAGISPADIDNITILKDAAATAIYGARAANGVIVITTKKGRSGKTSINYSSRLSYSPKYSIGRLNLLNASDKVDLELALLPTQDAWGSPLYPSKGGVAEILSRHNLLDAYRQSGKDALTAEALNEINALRSINTDWNDMLFRNAFTQEHNVSASGGNDRATYYTSLGYTNEQGNVTGVGMERFNLTTKLMYQFSKRFKAGASVFVSRRSNVSDVSDKYGNVNPVYYSRSVNPYTRPFDEQGNYIYNYDLGSGSEPDTKRGFNIYEERANTEQKTITTALNTIFDAEYRFDDHWKLSSQLGLQWEQLKLDEYVGKDTYTMRDIREASTYTSNRQTLYLIPLGARHRLQNRVMSQTTWKGLLEYKNTFAELHNLQVMLGSELRRNRYEVVNSTAYGYDPKTLTTKPIIYRNESDATRYPLHSESLLRNAFTSFFANGSYTYNDRYTLGASVRIDGSDLFGVDERYRYLPIYSVSGLWRLSNERFLSSAKWLDNLALRASYGLQGNIDKNTSPFLVGLYGTTSLLPGSSEEVITIASAPNDKLRWEKTASYNLGLDFAAFDQALNLSIDYYLRKGTDLIGVRSLPLENGFSSQTINWAQMDNQGIEVNLQTRNLTTKNFSWYTSLNFAYNQNKVLRVMTPDNQTTPSLEGYPVGAIFALPTAGIDPANGRILIANADGTSSTIEQKYKLVDEWGIGSYASGVTTEEERGFYRYIGSSDAPFTGGINNTFTYRNWELNLNIAYYLGGYVRTAPTYDITAVNLGKNTNQDILQRWTSEQTTSTLPALLTPTTAGADYDFLANSRPDIYRNLDMWVRPLNYFRLQNLRLAYRLPEGFLRSIGLRGATLALEGRNLWVFGSSYRNYLDPESMGNLYATPMPRTFTFHLNVNL